MTQAAPQRLCYCQRPAGSNKTGQPPMCRYRVAQHGRRRPLRLPEACLVSRGWMDVGKNTARLEAEYRLVFLSVIGNCPESCLNWSRRSCCNPWRDLNQHFQCFAIPRSTRLLLSLIARSSYFLSQHRPNPPMRWIPSMLWSKQKVSHPSIVSFCSTPQHCFISGSTRIRTPHSAALLSQYLSQYSTALSFSLGSCCCKRWFSSLSSGPSSLIVCSESMPWLCLRFTVSSWHICPSLSHAWAHSIACCRFVIMSIVAPLTFTGIQP